MKRDVEMVCQSGDGVSKSCSYTEGYKIEGKYSKKKKGMQFTVIGILDGDNWHRGTQSKQYIGI